MIKDMIRFDIIQSVEAAQARADAMETPYAVCARRHNRPGYLVLKLDVAEATGHDIVEITHPVI